MSKSSTEEKSKILLSDQPEVAYKKIMSATTDSIGQINYNYETQPGISSLLQILAQLTNTPQQEINQQWQGNTKYGDFKKVVASEVANFLTNFHEKLNSINDDEILQILEASEAKMNLLANAKLYDVQQAVGLRPKTNKQDKS